MSINYFLYKINKKCWTELVSYWKTTKQLYIGSHKKSIMKKNDICLIYIIDKKNDGFICVLNIMSDQLSIQNKMCFNITYFILPKPIHIDTIDPNISMLDTYVNKKHFMAKYVRLYLVFNSINAIIGKTIYDILNGNNSNSNNISIEQNISVNRNNRISYFDDTDDNISISSKENNIECIDIQSNSSHNDNSIDNIDSIDNISDNISVSSETIIEINKYGIIPILIELCENAINEFMDVRCVEADIIYSHLFNCDKCDITNNNSNTIIFKLRDIWKDMDISYKEIDASYDEYTNTMTAYQSLHKYTSDRHTNNIKLLNIIDQDDIYNNCLLLECNITE